MKKLEYRKDFFMNMRRWFWISNLPRFLFAAISMWYSTQSVVALPPDRLPIGSFEKARDWCVTNKILYPDVTIQYQQASGRLVTRQNGLATAKKFATYQEYQGFLLSGFKNLITKYRYDIATSNVTVLSTLDFAYSGSEMIMTAMYVIKNISIDSAQDDQITNALPSVLMPTISVIGMTNKPLIEVDHVISTKEPFYENTVCLPGWYCIGTNMVRITITSDGATKTYTQTGEPLEHPFMELRKRDLLIYLTPGSETTVESSHDLKSWQFENFIGWQNTSYTSSIPISVFPQEKRFFRCISN